MMFLLQAPIVVDLTAPPEPPSSPLDSFTQDLLDNLPWIDDDERGDGDNGNGRGNGNDGG